MTAANAAVFPKTMLFVRRENKRPAPVFENSLSAAVNTRRTFKDRRVLQPEVRGGNKIHHNPAAATCAGGGAVVPLQSISSAIKSLIQPKERDDERSESTPSSIYNNGGGGHA